MGKFWFILFLLVPSISQAKEYITTWDCSKNVRLVKQQEFKIDSDYVEAQADAAKLDGEIIALKDVEGHVAFMVKYSVNVASDNLFDNANCQHMAE